MRLFASLFTCANRIEATREKIIDDLQKIQMEMVFNPDIS